MLDKSKLGTRYACFQCGTKFYDLNRPVPSCPECGADQTEAPLRDIKSLLGKGRGKRKAPEPTPDEDEDEDDMDIDDDDDDDDDDDEDEDDEELDFD